MSTDEDDEPQYGYGRGDRPLWTERDRAAERIRDILRGAGRAEHGPARGGFAVEGGEGGEPFDVAWTGSDSEAAAEIAAYTKALTAAGFRIEPDDEDARSSRSGSRPTDPGERW